MVSAAAVLALVTAPGPALYCSQAKVHSMPCCKTSARCDLGMKAVSCCAVDPASGTPEQSAGSEARQGCAIARKLPHAASSQIVSPAMAILAAPGDGLLWHPPRHDGSPALYLRNNSILR